MVRLLLLLVAIAILVLAVRAALGVRRTSRKGELPPKRTELGDDSIKDADYTEV